MADIRVKDLDEAATPGVDYFLLTDSATDGVKKIKPSNTVTRASLAITNVDNTSDANKPISTATQTALDAKADASSLATVATSGAYSDLSGKPSIGTVAALNSGLGPGDVPVLDGSGRLPAVDGSQLTGLPGGGNVIAANYGSEYAANKALFRTNIGAVPGGGAFAVQVNSSNVLGGVALGAGATLVGRDSASPISTYHRGGVDIASVYNIDGTGATVVGAALQTAIDVMSVLTPNLYLRAGTYDVTGTRLRVPSNVSLMGDGSTFTVLKRTDDTNVGTVEVFNATNVRITGVGINYTPSTFTLGYGQTGFCARNGSRDVRFTDCAVTGKLNRQFHALNSQNIRFNNCLAIGGGDAGIRVVSDPNAAASYPTVVGDETSPLPVRNIWITECIVTGETALGNGTRSGLFYGISIASETTSTGTILHVFVKDCVVQYTNGQGIGLGAYVRFSHVKDCTIASIQSGASSGVGILLVTAGSKSPMYINVIGNNIYDCWYGIYSVGSIYGMIVANIVNGGNTGILLNGTNATKVRNNTVDSSAGDGISAIGSATNCDVSGNSAIGNVGTGIKSDATTSSIKFSSNRSYANGTNTSLLGTGHMTADNT